MIRGKAEIEDKDLGMRQLMREIRSNASHVDIGVHADEEKTLITIAAANEYGAKINHPGGTAYGYQTPGDARKGKVRFLKGGSGYKVLGKTRPHTIVIPARSYIRSTVDEKKEVFTKAAEALLGRMVDGEISKFQGLEIMGQLIESEIKRKITLLRSPPNAPATIRRKGSDNPLIDKGILRSSIRYAVKAGNDRKLGGD